MHTGVPLLGLVLVVLLVPALATATHVPRSDIQWACGYGSEPAADCGINAIHDPEFTTTSWIGDSDKVIGFVRSGEVRAYPVRMLDNHEIVSDVVGGVHVAVTWCPLCGSAIVFDRLVDIDGRKTLVRLDVSGYLYKHDLVMVDVETETLWTQIDGSPIARWTGDAVSADHPTATLTALSSELTTWKDWRTRHPDSSLLSNNGRSYGGAYTGYEDSCRFGISRTADCDVEGLHPKEEVIGVKAGETRIAFPHFGVRAAGGVVTTTVGSMQVVVGTTRGGAAWAYDAEGHTFEQDGAWWRDETGARWNRETGVRHDGGATLMPLDHRVMYWFAWQSHHPDTLLWMPPDEAQKKPLEGSGVGIPGVSTWWVVAVLGSVLAAARRRR